MRLASRVSIVSGLHEHGRATTSSGGEKEKGVLRRVLIGDRVWIGEGAIIGADVGADAIVSMGAVVTKNVPSRIMAMGNPARNLVTVNTSQSETPQSSAAN